MATPSPLILGHVEISPRSIEYRDILAWPFPQQPFYEAQIERLLRDDLPYRAIHSSGRIWAYRDLSGQIVGFGSLDLCREYAAFTDGKYHSYVPVLAVHPAARGKGYGRAIVGHLSREAGLVAAAHVEHCSELLFLDVYAANRPAVALYEKCGFTTLNPTAPILDSNEASEPYLVMAKRLV